MKGDRLLTGGQQAVQLLGRDELVPVVSADGQQSEDVLCGQHGPQPGAPAPVQGGDEQRSARLTAEPNGTSSEMMEGIKQAVHCETD